MLATAKMGRLLGEAGWPLPDMLQPLTPQDVERFVASCAKYGYMPGTPEENAAIEIGTLEYAAHLGTRATPHQRQI